MVVNNNIENFRNILKNKHIRKYFDPFTNNVICEEMNSRESFIKFNKKNLSSVDAINKIKNSNHYIKHNPSYPIEYRKYFTGSNGMDWHVDTSLFEPDSITASFAAVMANLCKFLNSFSRLYLFSL